MSFRLVIAALVGTAITSLASPAAGLAATGDVHAEIAERHTDLVMRGP